MQVTRPFLDSVPIWVMFLVILMVVLLSIEAGHRYGARKRKLLNGKQVAPVSSMIGATLGLLAFILAFTFGMAASRFDARKALTLDEANAIETTYLRAGLMPEPQRTDIRNLLREYQTGLEGARRTIVVLAVVFAFTVVMFVIADLDHSQMGFLQISQQPMIEVQASINKTAP